MTTDIPKGWKKVKLGEIAELKKNVWKVGSQILPYIGLEHIQEDKLRLNGIGNSRDVDSNKYIFTEEEFLFGRLRPYFRKLFKPNFQGVCSTDIWVVRPKPGIERDYLFYLFATKEFIDIATYSSGGTRMPRADWNFLSKTDWFIPENISEQRAIAEVLSSLDDKIDLLHRQNKTLEEMAMTLFRHYFINNPDREKWEEVKLGDVVEVKRGASPRPIHDYLDIKGYNWLKISDVTTINSPFILETKEFIKEEGLKNTVFLKSGALVLSNSASPGIPKILQIDACIHDGWLYFPKSKLSNEFLYLFFQTIRKHLVEQGNGSIFTNLKISILKNYKMKLPKKEFLRQFDKIVNPLFKKILLNSHQIRTLEQLRDTLLPKLMGGQIRVKM